MTETELWLVDLESTAAALEAIEAATPRLSADMAVRLAQMQDATARRERRLAHVALRILLERRLGASIRGKAFVIGPSGKPSLPAGDGEPGIGFSLAHTRGIALIATGPDPLGVDIERPRPVRMAPARRAPIEAEAIALANGAPLAGAPGSDARFLNAWVRIEAVAKASGRGVGALLEGLRPRREASGLATAARPVTASSADRASGTGIASSGAEARTETGIEDQPPAADAASPAAAPQAVAAGSGWTALEAFDVSVSDGVYAALARARGPRPPPAVRAVPAARHAIEALLGKG